MPFRIYNFMLEQQLQVSDDELSKESHINWVRIQKLYHHTAKSVQPPEPDYQGTQLYDKQYTHEDVQLLLQQFLKDFVMKHNQEIQSLEQKVNNEIYTLKKRINRLEFLLFEKTEQKEINKSREQGTRSKYQTPLSKSEKTNSEMETTNIKPKRTKSFIYIEQTQENDVSLLDELQPTTKEQTPYMYFKQLQKNRSKFKKSRFETEFQPRYRFEEDHQRDSKTNQSKINGGNCSFHQEKLKQLNQQIKIMKSYMENAYNMQIKDLPWLQKIMKEKQQPHNIGRQKIIISVSKNSQQHLINENLVLREMSEKYKRELKKAKREVSFVRKLLNQGLQQMITIQQQ